MRREHTEHSAVDPIVNETMSVWQGTYDVPAYPPLTRDATADVCVVGAGIAGLSAAYVLSKAGKKVVVLDDGAIGGGESGRTTAHLTAAMDDRIWKLEAMHGQGGARLIVQSHAAAIAQIEQIALAENMHCDFQRVDGFLFADDGDDAGTLDEERDAARRAGLTDVAITNAAPLALCGSARALRFPNQAQFHPLKYLTGLADAIVRLGGHVHCDTHVSAVKGGAHCRVKTSKGHTVRADAVCVCTNGSITDMTQTHLKQAPYRTYAIAAVIPRDGVPRALYWDTAHPYHYVRVQRLDAPVVGAAALDASPYDALIVGGEDHKTGHDDDADARWARLELWMRERWPVAKEVVYRWSGQVLEPADGCAFIGRNPDGAKNIYMVSGDSGQGMTHGTIAGLLLRDLICGQPNPWSAIYDPKRVTISVESLKDLARENLDVAWHYVRDMVSSPDVTSPLDIPLGEGRLMRRGVDKIAVYRSPDGTLHERSAACTHLKCTVHWNSAEKSWDCPCHGSRFDPLGNVLNGPAIEPLAPVSAAGGGRESKTRSRGVRGRKTRRR